MGKTNQLVSSLHPGWAGAPHSLKRHSWRHMGQCCWTCCALSHLRMQCMWKQCEHWPHTRGQSSPGTLPVEGRERWSGDGGTGASPLQPPASDKTPHTRPPPRAWACVQIHCTLPPALWHPCTHQRHTLGGRRFLSRGVRGLGGDLGPPGLLPQVAGTHIQRGALGTHIYSPACQQQRVHRVLPSTSHATGTPPHTPGNATSVESTWHRWETTTLPGIKGNKCPSDLAHILRETHQVAGVGRAQGLCPQPHLRVPTHAGELQLATSTLSRAPGGGPLHLEGASWSTCLWCTNTRDQTGQDGWAGCPGSSSGSVQV